MYRLSCLLFFVATLKVFSQQPLLKNVITHSSTTVVCDPSTGSKAYPGWGVFPSQKFPIRKITMKVSLGSPDSLSTAHWDYLDHITIRRKGGVYAKSLDYELGRLITPYGSAFGKGWAWTWEVDVTDFAPFLRDSVEIEYRHSGYESTSVGWKLTIDFEILSGPPVLRYFSINPLWNGQYKYGDPKDPIEHTLQAISFQASPDAQIQRIRIQHTGHGMDKPKGCSEFCSRWREMYLDENMVDHRDMWKDCGSNPLYPQGGTWIYDRAYWCPGELQQPDFIDIHSTAGKHQLTMKMEPYVATENIQAVESVSAYLFQYSSPVAKVDASIEKIVVPNDNQQFKRYNPAGFHPRIVIRNLGSSVLKSAIIKYGTLGAVFSTYLWKGNLNFNQTQEIILPGSISATNEINRFVVSLEKPNGVNDAWSGDNKLTSTFEAPIKMPTEFVVQFYADNKPSDNEFILRNEANDTLYHLKGSGLKPNTLLYDTIRIPEAKYDFVFSDSGGDGLEFWAEPQNGVGFLNLLDVKGNLLHSFTSDCGNGEKLSFSSIKSYLSDTLNVKRSFAVYPKNVKDTAKLSISSNAKANIKVVLQMSGKVIERHEYNDIKSAEFLYSVRYFPKGIFVVEVFVDGKSSYKVRLNKQ